MKLLLSIRYREIVLCHFQLTPIDPLHQSTPCPAALKYGNLTREFCEFCELFFQAQKKDPANPQSSPGLVVYPLGSPSFIERWMIGRQDKLVV